MPEVKRSGVWGSPTRKAQRSPLPSQQVEENCSHRPRRTPSQTPKSGAPGAFLRAWGLQVSGRRVPGGHLPALNSCPRRASPRLATSILLRCRSRPGSGTPCPAGGGTQARSPARGSPGEHRAGSILPESHGPSVRAGGGDRPASRPASSRSPRPNHPHTRRCLLEMLTCLLPSRRLLASRGAPLARAWRLQLPLRFPLPPGRSLRCRARSESLAESRRRRGGETASQRASGGAAVRSRPTGALALTAHPGALERESQQRALGSPPRLCGRGKCKGEKGESYQTRDSQSTSRFCQHHPSLAPLIFLWSLFFYPSLPADAHPTIRSARG